MTLKIVQKPLPPSTSANGKQVGCYFASEQRKSSGILHFTAGGSVDSAISWWRQQANQVATPFVIGQDGVVYQCFDPKYWAWSLGVADHYGVQADQKAVAVEMVNIGPLKLGPDGRGLFCYLDWDAHGNVKTDPAVLARPWCTLDQTTRYVAYPNGWRGVQYMAAWPESQVAACAMLMRQMCEYFNIPKQIMPGNEYDIAGAFAYKGVTTHHQWRADKWDVGPTFPWKLFQDVFMSV